MFNLENTYQYITDYCLQTDSRDPLWMAEELMHSDYVRVHGPEHHFLTAAVLCTAWCNAVGEEKQEHLEQLRIRCKKVPPAVCGYYGVCGDVLAAGAVMSEMLEVNYLSGETWQKLNAFTAKLQAAVAESCSTGPRCCKRTSYAVLHAAVDGLAEMGIQVSKSEPIRCGFSAENAQCIGRNCVFFCAEEGSHG